MSNRNQIHVKFSRVFNYFFIIDNQFDIRFSINNQIVNDNQFINSIVIRKISIEKVIYEQLIEFQSTIIIINDVNINSIIQIVIIAIVIATMTQIFQQLNQQIQQQIQQID